MAKNPLTRSAGLEVTANDGAVVITGNVGSSKAVEAVAELAKVVPGVKSLRPDVGMGADWHLQRPTEYCRIKPRGISSAPGRRRLLTARS